MRVQPGCGNLVREPLSEEAIMEPEGLDSFTLARVAQIEATRRAVMPSAPFDREGALT